METDTTTQAGAILTLILTFLGYDSWGKIFLFNRIDRTQKAIAKIERDYTSKTQFQVDMQAVEKRMVEHINRVETNIRDTITLNNENIKELLTQIANSTQENSRDIKDLLKRKR